MARDRDLLDFSVVLRRVVSTGCSTFASHCSASVPCSGRSDGFWSFLLTVVRGFSLGASLKMAVMLTSMVDGYGVVSHREGP